MAGRAISEWLESRRLLATLPAGFIQTRIATGLENPTAAAVAPDGRIFVSEQAGRIRVVSAESGLLSTPFITLSDVDSRGEFGLQAVAFDPDFASNRRVYINYTYIDPTFQISRQRIIRVTADASGSSALPGSQTMIYEFDPLFTGLMHVGGAMRFLPDGTLLAAHGDNGFFAGSQLLTTTHGKVVRINTDGSIPADNPYYSQTQGKYRAIWAVGLRNPYTIDVEPFSGRTVINDVGGANFEEVNKAVPGANYGWPTTEGHFDPAVFPEFAQPIFSYAHDQGCAITGGVFYNPAEPDGPGALGSEFVGKLFVTDFCGGWMRVIDFAAASPSMEGFATGIDAPVYPLVAGDGSLYYLERNTGSVFWVQKAATLAPFIANSPQDATVSIGQPASFAVVASGPGLSYQWQRDGQDIPAATSSSYTLQSPELSDSGATFSVRVSNTFGSVLTTPVSLLVINNHVPAPSITSPAYGALYSGGDTVQFSGLALDVEDGVLSTSALTWWVDFHHNTHSHPFIPETAGIDSGSFQIPPTGETDADVFYRIHLRAVDAIGAPAQTSVDVLPRTAVITLRTVPSGITILLDGQPRATPLSFVGVAGIVRELAAPLMVDTAGQAHEFVGWSDGDAATHTIFTPADDSVYTATYRDITRPELLEMEFLFDSPFPAPPHLLRFVFSEDVAASLNAGDIQLLRLEDDEPFSGPLAYDAATNSATMSFPEQGGGQLPEGNYRLALRGAGITDAQGNALGSDNALEFFVLPADADRNRTVNIADFSTLAARFNMPGTFSQGDFDYDGTTAIGDFAILASRFNTTLSQPRTLSPQPTSAIASFRRAAMAHVWSAMRLYDDSTTDVPGVPAA